MAQLDLFSLTDQQSPLPQPPPNNEEAIDVIEGFGYIENYINENEHDQLLYQIDKKSMAHRSKAACSALRFQI